MTNEEKAMNLSGICSNCEITTCHINWCQRRDMYDGAIEMAKWKDEQELKFLQELCVHSNLAILFEKMQNRIKELEATLNL